MMPPTCTEGDTKCEDRTLYECVGGVWVRKQGPFPCPNCKDKECGGESTYDGEGNIIYTPPSCC